MITTAIVLWYSVIACVGLSLAFGFSALLSSPGLEDPAKNPYGHARTYHLLSKVFGWSAFWSCLLAMWATAIVAVEAWR